MSRQLRKRKVVEAAPAEAPPISKKIKKDVPRPAAPHRRSRKKGSETVHSLSNMPLEIIYEILGYTPTDGLISLAPTTKGFRLLLMTRRSYSLWKESRQFVKGLPDCPSFLNEIAYANLCFQTFCHNCLSPNIHDVLWTLRVRTCKKCHNTLLIESDHPDFVPFWRVFYHAPFIFKPSSVRWDTGVSRIFNQSDLQTAPLTATGTTWMNWTEEQKRLSNEIKMWADACEQWHASYLQSCKDELDKIKKARLFTVIEKLRDLGWDEDLKDMAKASEEAETPHPLLDFKQVKQTRPLTDKIWSNMQDEVITFMQGWKDKRLVKARYKLLESCIGSLREAVKQFEEDLGGFCPNIRDIASFPEFREIIESPSDVTVTDLTFHALKEKLVDLVLQQRQEQKVLIHQLIERKVRPSLPDDIDIFDLAICQALVCSDCKMIFKDMSEQYDDPLCHFGFNTRVIITWGVGHFWQNTIPQDPLKMY
ncbi:hypothetical protein QCA50_020181 [Cerrena zonata]|uniref:F-box domain-containing protein n=1 Tax=Cerrena zonata TaxID=2478898 RepID=A0AAW0F828_9APHY